jgi:hypothetical protein
MAARVCITANDDWHKVVHEEQMRMMLAIHAHMAAEVRQRQMRFRRMAAIGAALILSTSAERQRRVYLPQSSHESLRRVLDIVCDRVYI